MHMADALLSAPVGAAFWGASAVALGVAARRVRQRADDRLAPLMGVLGAFVFAAQMINFSIPATGSSGHLGGGLLLAALLGPAPALLVIASVLVVQALFFADGGLLALGANIFNMGVIPCLVVYPLLYRTLAGAQSSATRIWVAALVSAIVALQLGALGVVLQTRLSGISELPFGSFLLLMQPIHLAIGVVEGLATAALLLFVRRHQPELLDHGAADAQKVRRPRRMLVAFALAAAVAGGALSWFASSQPDGLEWSIEHAATGALTPPQGIHAWLGELQERVALLPDYDFGPDAAAAPADHGAAPAEARWPAVHAGTSLAGLVGGGLTLLLVSAVALLLRRRAARAG